MNHLMMSVVVAVVLVATAATVLRSHAPSTGHTVGVVSSKAPPTPAGASKLPTEEYEDMSLIYSSKDRSAHE
jgi:hypothetical protein